MDELKQSCFFCSDPIEGKKTREHIIPNSLLGKLDMKEETVTGIRETQYSRVKVPSHASCNNVFGSKYEEKVLKLLEDLDSLYDMLKAEEGSIPMMYMPEESATAIITTWLSKIYYGFFYYDLLTTQDEQWKEVCSSIVNSINFNYVRMSYRNGHGFQLPSSLYVFKTKNTKTDFNTVVNPSSLLIKIKSLTLILCVCDGFLTKNYLLGKNLERLREFIIAEENINPDLPAHKLAFAEILALRSCIPKTPKFASSENQIMNLSLMTGVANPKEFYKIDLKMLEKYREKFLRDFNFEINPSTT